MKSRIAFFGEGIRINLPSKWILLFACPFLLFPQMMGAHPAHAEPVNYPYVVGFERFHTSLDQPRHFARGGLILLNELNCVACHKPPKELQKRLPGRPGSNLAGVGSRFTSLDLEMMIRNPRFIKSDTAMPSLFAGPDRDLDEILALKHFLSTLTKPLPEYPAGDVERGRILYHKIGCVACHAPEKDYRPPWVPGNIELTLAGLPSVPMNLADRYPKEAVTDLILDPAAYRPSGRMPRFPLTVQEAADLGAYLNSAPKPELPEILKKALAAAEPFEPDAELTAKGRELFGKKNCVACHAGVTEHSPALARPLGELSFSTPAGCLSERPPGHGVPAYGLDKVQKKAIVLALETLASRAAESPEDKIDWVFATRNCYACHERNGKGGPESARQVFFTVNDRDALGNGLAAVVPPALDRAGAKLTSPWWNEVLFHQGGSGTVRPFMSTRMPIYRKSELDSVVESIQNHVEKPPLDFPEPGDPARGHRIVDINHKNCVACHGVGELPPPGDRSISLNETTRRLREEYFHEWLEAPPADHPRLSKTEAADVWAYLERIGEFAPPDGLLLPDRTEITVEKESVVIRTALEDLSDDALAVIFRGDWTAVFDIETCRWKARWKGRSIDPGPDWKSAQPVQLSPLKTVDHIQGIWFPKSASTYIGYDLSPDGLPTILYRTESGQMIRDTLKPNGDRIVKIGQKTVEENWIETEEE